MYRVVLQALIAGFLVFAPGKLPLASADALPGQANPEATHCEGGCLGHEEADLELAAEDYTAPEDWAERIDEDAFVEEGGGVSLAVVPGPISPASGQPSGALSGRLVFTTAGHGWTYEDRTTHSLYGLWRLQRGLQQEMNEDTGNLDQMNMFVTYCFNAGATIAAFRPIGYQTNEVVLDNVSAGVTFSGPWANSSATSYYYGTAGQVSYRYATVTNTETATATYAPNIPQTGFYPVYTWVRHGSDRTDQLYRINHTGGQSLVRVPHYMIGNFWVYLGTYYFNAGSNPSQGSVIISNLRQSPTGSVVIADAIRFGNGMGSINRGHGVSGYPREDENSRYWVQAGLGVGMPSNLYDYGSYDESDSWYTPPRMTREMNREQSGNMFKRIYINYHSNAGGGRGTVGLINSGSQTPNQARLAKICGDEVTGDLVALGSPPLEHAWQNRTSTTYSGGYAEISNGQLSSEMDATIIEVAFHDNEFDARLMRDPKARSAVARASYHAVIKYMNEFDGLPLNFLPEPPTNVRALATSTGVAISWNVPTASGGSGAATGYVVYRSTDGYGFGNPVAVAGGSTTTVLLTDVPANTDVYFRVAATNAGGESLPSATVGCRRSSNFSDPKILVVNGFERFDRTTNLRQNLNRQNWRAPGPTGAIERVLPRSINSFDYIVQHGKAINAFGMAFDSCQRAAVLNNQVNLSNYQIVIWAAGQEFSNVLNSTAQTRISTFLANGGNLFISGSEIARDLGRSASSAANKSFLQNQLRAVLASESHTNSQTRSFSPVAGSIFAGNASGTIDDGTRGTYWVQYPDVLTPASGGTAAMNYSGGIGGAAAVQYNGAGGGGRVVFFGFPFETITSSSVRNAYMADILSFLGTPPPTGLPEITSPPASQTVFRGWDTTFSVAATGQPPLFYQWRINGGAIPGATNDTLTLPNVQTNQAGQYSVTVSNSVGITTSPAAMLTVNIPYVTATLFTDNFDTNSASRWVTNRSSTDTRVTFNYNYANDGIPAAPNSVGGTRRGVKFEANMTLGATAAICISPAGGNFSGDFDLRFDMWINANGPFPQGGNGSTEHLTAGVGTTGSRIQWAGAGTTADGTWFAVDGEGQAGDTTQSVVDFMAFLGTAAQSTNTGFYAAGTAANARGNNHPYYAATFPGGQTAPAAQVSAHPNQTGALAVGTVGMKWRDVKITRRGTTVEWFIDNLRIASITNATFNGNNIFIGYWDGFASLSDNSAMSFGLVDNLRVEVLIEAVPPAITAHPQNRSVIQGNSTTFSVSATGTTNLAYQWKFNDENIPGATAATFMVPSVQPGHEGAYSVVVTNIAGRVTSSSAVLTVLVPPSIVSQPESQSARPGDTVGFTVEAAGSEPLFFQWYFGDVPLSGATNSSFSFIDARAEHAGIYTVTVTNAAGSVTSQPATLAFEAPSEPRFASFAIDGNGRLELLVEGDPGASLLIQVSTNLMNWTTLTNLVIGNEGTAELLEELASTNSHRFYRAVSGD